MPPLPACRAVRGLFLALGLLNLVYAQTPAAPPVPTAPDPIEGTWTGTITAPQCPADIGFRFERDAKGALVYALQFPAMNAFGVKFGAPVGRDGEAYTEPIFQSRLMLVGDRLTGTFGPGKLLVELARGGSFSPAPPAPVYPAAPAPLWSQSLGSYTWASPVVRDDLIYVGTKDGKFHAVRATDGGAIWTWTGPNRIDGRAVPTDDSVYFVDGKNDLGGERAPRILPDPNEQPADGFDHDGPAPVVTDGVLYIGSADGSFHAVNATNGTRLWRLQSKGQIRTTAEISGSNVIFSTLGGLIQAADRSTGKEVWQLDAKLPVTGSPALIGGKLIIGGRNSLLYGMNPATGAIDWKFSSGARGWNPPRPTATTVSPTSARRICAASPASIRKTDASCGKPMSSVPRGAGRLSLEILSTTAP